MRTTYFASLIVVGLILFGSQDRVRAQEPPAAPHTLWHFLGIPQAVHGSYDGLINRKGEHPGLERKPPLKALADPANLASDNPAIKAAAEIKQQEDLKPQKIKAIKYLAEIACGCYPGVKEALLAALDDCTEEVRYEAAVAFCKAAGNPCSLCNRATCCDPQVKDKLKDMAQGTDANGCCKEPSARVRAAAAMALNACNQIPAVAPAERKEGPTPAERKEGSERGLQAPLPPGPAPTTQSTTQSLISPVSLTTEVFDRPVSPEPLVEGGAAGELNSVSVQHSGIRGIACRCPRCLGRGARPVYPAAPAAPGAKEPAPSPAEERAEERAEAAPGAPPAPAPTALAGTFGAARAPASAAPNMIGDLFGGGYSYLNFDGETSAVSIAAGDRNFKIAENDSAIPMDRVFFNYNHFSNALETFDGAAMPLDRFNLGIEKTFWDGNWSVELRVPFARGLDSAEVVGQGAGFEGTEFGNVAMVLKAMLLQRRCSTLTAGLGVVFPTGSDSEVLYDNGDGSLIPLASVENEAVHFSPFLAYLWTPNDRLFAQFFSQVDFDANGNETLIRGIEGRLQDQSLLFLDMSMGYWIYRDRCARFLKGVAPVVELHYTTTLESTDFATGGRPQTTPSGYDIAAIANLDNRQDILNLTGGVHFQLFQSTMLTVGGACPLRSDSDREFDAEFMLQLNHYY